MKILIIESCEKKKDLAVSSIVHVRNSIILSKELDADLLHHISGIESIKDNKYDAIICAYSSPYMKYYAYLEFILKQNDSCKFYWLVNDHDVEDNILLRKWNLTTNRSFDMICNNPRSGYRGWILNKKYNGKKLNDWIENWHTLNLNTLIYDGITSTLSEREGVVYYGTFRKHRIADMLDYNALDYDLSSSVKNHAKFREAGITANFVDRFSFNSEEQDEVEPIKKLSDYKFSLYFEDKHTHDNYAYMANRFYECLSSNVLMLFDYRCAKSMAESGYSFHKLQTTTGSSIVELIAKINADNELYEEMLSIQQSNHNTVVKERESVICQLRSVIG